MTTSSENPFFSDTSQPQGPPDTFIPPPALESAADYDEDSSSFGGTDSSGDASSSGELESLRRGYLSRRILELLPELLAEPAFRIGQRGDLRKRDVFLTGALPVWAGALPNVRFRYGGTGVSPNLYSAVVAPPASGKSALRHARKYGRPSSSTSSGGTSPEIGTSSENRSALESGASPEGRASAQGSSTGQEGPEEEPSGRERPGVRAGRRQLFLAADSSAAALKQRLEEVPHGVIFETEFQALSRALGSSWGSFTDVLLKGLQNEAIRMSRSSKGAVTIPHPAPSIALAGTPAALGGFMSGSGSTPGTGNGLFSRFLFYRFDREFEWSPQFRSPQSESTQSEGPQSEDLQSGERRGSLEESLRGAGQKFREARRQLGARETPLWVSVPGALQEAHTRAFRSLTKKWREDGNVPRSMQASLTRAGLQAVKIAVVLRGVRLAESGVPPASTQSIELGAEDMEAGIRLSLTYLLHAIEVGARLQGDDGPQDTCLQEKALQEKAGSQAKLNERKRDLTERQREYLEALPEEPFSTAEAKDLASGFGASKRGVQRWLKSWRKAGLLRKPKRGMWAKRRPEREDSPRTEGLPGAESVISVIDGIPALAGGRAP
ncbi:hypothetical protein GGP77_003290 [Salinibacter ruber]|uniref:YfjI family protein n=1 Tax=Salinibacter ruber TaxID=146919 RepID=UPI002166E588|nr:YfjI family protein [Salinibacter ruber]MCS3669035.1 hypothetical protein [Salinibacter ruber]